MARRYRPLIVNTVVGFMGPEYLANGKQIIRAGLEDHFCAKLMGVPMGCDVCYTNHIDADQDDMDVLLTMLAAAGCNYVIGIPGADDVMLNYQSTSFHDAVYVRRLLGLRPAPEFESWLESMGVHDRDGNLRPAGLSVKEAVLKLCYLLQGAFVRKLSGVSLKDDMPAGYLPFAPQYSSLSGAR